MSERATPVIPAPEATDRRSTGFALSLAVSLRPKQWVKNLLVFAALIFAGKVTDPKSATAALVAFGAMCLLSSATYLVNDLLDRARDRAHPKKRFRPIASGALAPFAAGVTAAVFASGALAALATLNRTSVAIAVSYLAIQMAYNFGLKRVPVADVFSIACGFVLRAVLGAAAIWVPISPWLLLCTGALALTLGFAKRRGEALASGPDAGTRESLAGYSSQALDSLVLMTATASALCYAVYSIESPTGRKHSLLAATTLFVAYGVARYVHLVFSQNEGEEPEETLFRDRHLQAAIVLFIASALFALGGAQVPILEQLP